MKANILPCTPHDTGYSGEHRYLVEWNDAGLTRTAYFASYRSAQRFAAKIERALLEEILIDLNGKNTHWSNDRTKEAA